ncbi:DUF4157 domain-containing protein [Haloarcula sp. 1CSR25-25]|uniref:eCIS core domain-containing protein n=1 Tax=Haloarcula sp. 1CSR25-25 TaxID=2862545 RepID=UPI00289435E1|nr:DUF4157 domain-containing protein [Haloarcula sp. 1CSR25-25]MDT3435984.1 DUF4157 domain-containing protein [Haloarcula sp. 1CSR25-25]
MNTHESETERSEGPRRRRADETATSTHRETEPSDRERSGGDRGERPLRRPAGEQRIAADSTDAGRGSTGRVARLQRTLGNRAVAQAATAVKNEAAEGREPSPERTRTGPAESAEARPTEQSDFGGSEQSADRSGRSTAESTDAPSRVSGRSGPATGGQRSPVSGPQPGSGGPNPVARAHAYGVQPKLTVGRPNDEFEREADAVAAALATGGGARSVLDDAGRPTAATDTDLVQPQTDGTGADPPPRASAITSTIRRPGAGRSIPRPVRSRIEPALGTSLGGVRVHDGTEAARAASGLGARALTRDNHIFLGDGESPHDLELMAHEATHVVQQGAASEGHERAATPSADVQRLLPESALRKLNDWAEYIPGWTLFTVLIGYNPLLGETVERTPDNLVEGLLSLVPFGPAIIERLRGLDILGDAFQWVTSELKRLNLTLARVRQTLEAAWDDVSVAGSLLGIGEGAVDVLERHFGTLYEDVKTFARSLVDRVVEFIEEAVVEQVQNVLDASGAWSLFTKVLRRDPLRGEDVEATPTEILEDFLRLIGREQHLQKMREQGVVTEAAEWIATQVETFTGLLTQLQGLVEQLWEAISPANLASLWETVSSFVSSVGSFLQRVWTFATTVAGKVLELVKDALVGTLQKYVTDNLPGFELLTVVLGRNPFTGERVARTPETIMHGFITLLPGGSALYQKLAETGAVAQAGTRIQEAMTQLGITWEFVVGLFRGVWESLSIEALMEPVGAFQRIIAQFRKPVSRLFSFISVVLRELFSVVLRLMNFPTGLIGSIVSNAMQAITVIKQDPVKFLLNMLGAVKLGFQNFFTNILTHLGRGLADWLFRGLRDAGIEPPTDLSLGSVLEFVLQVLGVTMDRIWAKLAERIGQENVDRIRGAIDKLTGIWNFVADVQERGVGAIWEYIQGQVTGLWDMVLAKAREWVMERVINRATRWLLSLLDPTGVMAVINGFSAFLSAVQSAGEYAVDILRIVNDYVSTIASVARGELAAGAAKLEQGLANAVPVAIGFLANQFGLGNIGEKITGIVAQVRGVVDRALDWLIDKAVSSVQSVLRAVGIGGKEEKKSTDETGEVTVEKVPFSLGSEQHRFRARFTRTGVVIEMASNGWQEFEGRLQNLKKLYITENRKGYSEETKNALAQRLDTIAGELQSLLLELHREPNELEEKRKANEGIDRLEAMFSPLGGAPFYIETEGSYQPPRHRFESGSTDGYKRATGALGDPISKESKGKGSSANVDPAGITILNDVSGISKYERGHLVAKTLGGPGNDRANLTPISPATNIYMRDNPEQAARDAIDKTVTPKPVLMRYTVRTTHGGKSELESWLVSTIGAAPGGAESLFKLAAANARLTPTAVHAALGGSAQLPLATVESNLDAIRKNLAYAFHARQVVVQIDVLQGGVSIKSTWSIDNHMGASIPEW